MVEVTKTHGLPGFVNGKDKLDNYILRFEKYATIAGGQRDAWAVRLSPLPTGKALDIYSGLLNDDVCCFIKNLQEYKKIY